MEGAKSLRASEVACAEITCHLRIYCGDIKSFNFVRPYFIKLLLECDYFSFTSQVKDVYGNFVYDISLKFSNYKCKVVELNFSKLRVSALTELSNISRIFFYISHF